jgi:molecular chaperone Hsp33
MSDQLVRLHLKGPNLLAVALIATDTARRASELHRCLPTSAGLFAQGIAAGLGIAGLLGGKARINLQLVCDGPLKSLFVDADAEGSARGYVKNPMVNFLSGAARVEDAPALGGEGMLSVLRELSQGEYYRGSIALEHFDIARDLERYYLESEQIETFVSLDVLPGGEDQPLGQVAGLFVQKMPDAEPGVLTPVRERFANRPLIDADAPPRRTFDLLEPLFDLYPGDWELHAEYPLAWNCGCSAERVLRAVTAMGRTEIEDMLATEGRAVATCAFCGTKYEVSAEELRELLERAEAAR